MTLKAPNGEKMTPIACIPIDWGKPGYIVLQNPGGGYRSSYSIVELMKHNPPWLVEAYLKSLNDDFLKWLDSQERAINSKDLTYRWEEGDIPPFWLPPESERGSFCGPDNYVDQPEDNRTEADYLSYGDDEPVRCPRHTSKKVK
jgi:hypothetical protein